MLFIIDMQNDFVDQRKGKMLVRDADILVPGIIRKIKEYKKRSKDIFYTLDIHGEMKDDNRSKEEKKWGQSVYEPLKEYLEPHIYLKKIYYGITPEKASMLKEVYRDKAKSLNIEIIGVETEVCVLSNAIIIQNMFPNSKVTIDSSLCTSNNLKLHKKALEIMKNLKMEVL